jgi:hypothetical protein
VLIETPEQVFAEYTAHTKAARTGRILHHLFAGRLVVKKGNGLRFDPELLYAGAMFHDMGLTDQHSSADERFEVDGANAARNFLRSRGIAQQDIETVCAPGHSSGDGRRRNGRAWVGL